MKISLRKVAIYMSVSSIWAFMFCTVLAMVSMANSGNAQNTRDVIITVNYDNTTLIGTFQDIESKTPFRFLYEKERIENIDRRVTIDLTTAAVEDILIAVSEQTGVGFRQTGSTIAVKLPIYHVETNQVQRGIISGKVTDARNGDALVGATVLIDDNGRGTRTDLEGRYVIADLSAGRYTLTVSYLGYRQQSREIELATNQEIVSNFELEPASSQLQEVEIVSTGYQEIPLERAAGSFFNVSREILETRVTSNIIDRLEDNIPGLVFQRDIEQRPVQAGESQTITIRGVSTILSSRQPLIVVDGFPYDGDIRNINPNTVESVTILKDASAASIWGARAGNGVIVITTRQGTLNRRTRISFNSATTIGDKPDVYHFNHMSVPDYVDAVETLFNHGHFQYPTTSSTTIVPPLMQILMDRRDGVITDQQAAQQLDYFKQQDIRRDLDRYFYRQSQNRQLSLNINGGSANQHYSVSLGFDDHTQNVVANSNQRYTIDIKNHWEFLDNKLTVSSGLNFARTINEKGNERGVPVNGITYTEDNGLFPYSRLVDDFGNPVGVPLYNNNFIENSMANGLLDWYFYPLNEIGLSPEVTDLLDYRINASVTYALLPGLKFENYYQYWNSLAGIQKLNAPNSYMVRNMINTFTQVNADGTLTYPVPSGGILDYSNSSTFAHNYRSQLQFNRPFQGQHLVTALIGFEVRDQQGDSRSGRFYGYDDNLGLSQNVDYINSFRSYLTGGNSMISSNVGITGTINRFISQYGNASYTYLDRYTITGSFRRDASNIFGVDTNNRVKPLWSVGMSWTISDESFYNFWALPYLKLRATYGYNGNVNNSLAAQLTARYSPANFNTPGLPVQFVSIVNPPNPNLRWEKINIINSGLDFSFIENRLKGSLEYYLKYGQDLIGNEPFHPSSGVLNFQGNFANTKTHGLDLILNIQMINREVNWYTDLNFSYINEKVTHYGQQPSVTQIRGYGSGTPSPFIPPVVGRPMFAVYTYHWAGLDPETGDPMGYLNGERSTNWNAIMSSYTVPEDMQYHGPGRPPFFGAVRNTWNWNNISLSANISYRFGYFFKRPTLNYSRLLTATGPIKTVDEFAKRWQQPGDEMWTDVPSFRPELTSAQLSPRQIFYQNSAAIVEPGDHIRLQDLMISYTIRRNQWMPLERAQIYIHSNNLGILWKASKNVKDPDYRNYAQAIRSVSFGIRVDY